MIIQINAIPNNGNAYSIAVDHRQVGTVTRFNGRGLRGPWTFKADRQNPVFAAKDGRLIYGWITSEVIEAFFFGPRNDM